MIVVLVVVALIVAIVMIVVGLVSFLALLSLFLQRSIQRHARRVWMRQEAELTPVHDFTFANRPTVPSTPSLLDEVLANNDDLSLAPSPCRSPAPAPPAPLSVTLAV